MVHGYVAPGYQRVARVLRRQLAKRGGGAAVAAYHRGRPVVDLWGGVRDETGAPWERDTLCVSYSTTKGVVSTALHLLVDRGRLDYDDPVSRHWPEFAAGGKAGITIRDVMSHRAGLFNIRDLVDDAHQMLDWDHMTAALAAARPSSVPSGHTAYQALTYGYIVGELIRRVGGRHVPEFVQAELAAPLRLDGLYIGAPPEARARSARLVDAVARRSERSGGQDAGGRSGGGRSRRRRQRAFQVAEKVLRAAGHPVDFGRAAEALAPPGISRFDFSSDEVLAGCIPAANGLFSARSLARLYAALAGGGELDGVRLLSPETLARATEIQTRGFDQITLFRMRWRLGYHRVGTFRGVQRGAFGHFGWGGSGAWADPARQLSLAYVVNTGAGTPIGDLRIMQLGAALLRGAGQGG
jgi:CubicO group peptidase (beta-lactamase class C family)